MHACRNPLRSQTHCLLSRDKKRESLSWNAINMHRIFGSIQSSHDLFSVSSLACIFESRFQNFETALFPAKLYPVLFFCDPPHRRADHSRDQAGSIWVSEARVQILRLATAAHAYAEATYAEHPGFLLASTCHPSSPPDARSKKPPKSPKSPARPSVY